MWKIPSFFWLEKCLFLWVSPLLLISNTQVSLAEKPQMKQKHWYLISTWSDKAFKGTGFRSGISIFARIVIWNYAYSLFNSALRLWWLSKLKNPLFQNEWTHKTWFLKMFSKHKLKKKDCCKVTSLFNYSTVIFRKLWNRKTTLYDYSNT